MAMRLAWGAAVLLVLGACSGSDSDGDGTGFGGVGGTTASGGSSAGTSSAGSSNAGNGNAGNGNAGNGNAGSGNAGNGNAGSSSSGGSGPSGNGSEPPELAGILQAHNDARAGEGADLPMMVWDDDLAAIAKAWGEQCVNVDSFPPLIDHNPGRSDNYPEYVGENIYASSGNANGPAAVSSWMEEKAHYDYASNSCAPGEQCGHYTQVVWRESVKLGCALVNCPNVDYPSTIICNYAPGGNFGGDRPY